jgi:hypothetical protein
MCGNEPLNPGPLKILDPLRSRTLGRSALLNKSDREKQKEKEKEKEKKTCEKLFKVWDIPYSIQLLLTRNDQS